jgi:hypothetical protein
VTPNEQRAERALKYFWDRVQTFTPHNPMGFEEFKIFITTKASPRFFALFGSALATAGLEESRVKTLMQKLADGYRGDLPKAGEVQRFIGTILGEVTSFSFRASAYAAQAAEGVKQAAAIVGKVAVGGVLTYAAFAGVGLAVLMYAARKK